jgi:type I restriction enzyme, S subunit
VSGLSLVRLKEVVVVVSSWNPQRAEDSEPFRYIDLSAVDQDTKVITGARILPCGEAPSRARQLVRTDDVLVSTVRPNLNGVALVPRELDGSTASTGFCVIRPNPKVLAPSYLFQWVKTKGFIANMVQQATGASYPAVSDKIILESRLPLPPLAEQQRIAAILNKADALREKRRESIGQLDRLAESMFLHMFGEPVGNPRAWPTRRLSELTRKMGSGSTPTGGDAAYKKSGTALIRSMNVHDGRFVRTNLAFIDEAQAARLKNVIVEEDDVLLNITGASVARVCRAPRDALPARVNQHVMIIRPISGFSAVFLEAFLLTPSMKKHLLKVGAAGATREAITKAEAEELKVITPPVEDQARFERSIRELQHLRKRFQSSLTRLDGLFTSLQNRAFAGEL